MSTNPDRIEMIKAYYAKQEKVKVESPPHISKTTQGNIVRYFTGKREGYDFVDGVAYVDKHDVHKFRGQHFIIHEYEEYENGVNE